MKRLFLIATIILPMLSWAQSETDMLDFSYVNYQGTAKSAAMGNAVGAIGSDFSGIAINPAGLGLFRKATFIYTPEFYITSTTSKYNGGNGFDRSFKLPMNNLGLTWTQDINEGALKTVSFALGINTINNYAYSAYINGDNNHTSLVDAYFSEIYDNGVFGEYDLEDYSPNILYPLWQTYILNFDDDGNCYTPVPQGGLNQKYGVSKRGNSREFSFASGFNFNEKLYLGLSVNIPYFERKVNTEYKETNLFADDFKNWSQSEYLTSSGYGINAKFGAILYPAKWIRLGVAFHTPSIYGITDSWYTGTWSSFSDGSFSWESPVSTYSYTITTPLHLNASAALIFGNFGMITGDYEYVDYSKMRASSHDYDYTALNDFISETYKATSNIRVGTEWRWQNLAFRAGYAINGSPFGFDKEDLKMTSYSCGFGYTYHRFTLDAAYVLSQRKNSYDLYSQYSLYPAFYGENNEFVDETKVKETTNINRVVISFKFRLD